MERPKNPIAQLTDVEYQILDVLYFVEPLDKILDEVDFPAAIVMDSLRFLLDHRLVSALAWDAGTSDFQRTAIYDTDNLGSYRFLATKDGLFAHNTR